jgi:cation transport ATPase
MRNSTNPLSLSLSLSLWAGGLAEFSLETPFYVAAGMSFCGFVLGYFYITEPNHDEDEDSDNSKGTSGEDVSLVDETAPTEAEKAAKKAADDEEEKQAYAKNANKIRLLWGAIFFGNLGFRSMIVMLALWVNYKFGWSTKEFGFMASAVGIVGIASNLVLFGKMVERWGTLRTAIISAFLAFVFWAATFFVQRTQGDGGGNFWTGPLLFIVVTIFRTCFNAIYTVSSKTLLAK